MHFGLSGGLGSKKPPSSTTCSSAGTSTRLSGSAANAPRGPELVLSDPKLGVLGEAPRALDGKSYQLVVVRGDGQRRLSEAEARRRRGVPQAAALWRQGKWLTSGWCPLNLP